MRRWRSRRGLLARNLQLTYKSITQRAPNAKVLEPTNSKEFKAFDAVNEKLDKLLATAAVGK